MSKIVIFLLACTNCDLERLYFDKWNNKKVCIDRTLIKITKKIVINTSLLFGLILILISPKYPIINKLNPINMYS